MVDGNWLVMHETTPSRSNLATPGKPDPSTDSSLSHPSPSIRMKTTWRNPSSGTASVGSGSSEDAPAVRSGAAP